jgi:ABC transporter ATM
MRNINQTLLSKARTSIFIAHRYDPTFSLPLAPLTILGVLEDVSLTLILKLGSLKTIADSDLIILLADGYVAEQGTHSELMNKKGRYYDMWQMQNEVWEVEDEGKKEDLEEIERKDGETVEEQIRR